MSFFRLYRALEKAASPGCGFSLLFSVSLLCEGSCSPKTSKRKRGKGVMRWGPTRRQRHRGKKKKACARSHVRCRERGIVVGPFPQSRPPPTGMATSTKGRFFSPMYRVDQKGPKDPLTFCLHKRDWRRAYWLAASSGRRTKKKENTTAYPLLAGCDRLDLASRITVIWLTID
nr:hypothetical protein [Pandoravirus massiliensis]